MSERLLTHYEAKYADARNALEPIDIRHTPRNRFLCCVGDLFVLFTGALLMLYVHSHRPVTKHFALSSATCFTAIR